MANNHNPHLDYSKITYCRNCRKIYSKETIWCRICGWRVRHRPKNRYDRVKYNLPRVS